MTEVDMSRAGAEVGVWAGPEEPARKMGPCDFWDLGLGVVSN